MPGYQIEFGPDFIKSCERVEKSHYRKNPKGAKEFKIALQQVVADLSGDPFQIPRTRQEPSPHGTPESSWEFRKMELPLPRYSGAAGCGRIIYLVNRVEQRVWLLWIYTHKEEKGRPCDKTLLELIMQVLEQEKKEATARSLDPDKAQAPGHHEDAPDDKDDG